MSETVKGIRQAARQRQRADTARREATDRLRELCRQAQNEGVPVTEIAREAGLSRQGVYDLLAARPS